MPEHPLPPPPPPPPPLPPLPVEASPRRPCPVCLGARLERIEVVPGLVLDRCGRCGGLWLDRGEVAALRRTRAQTATAALEVRPEARTMACRSCRALHDRDAPRCPVCGADNVVDCPVCGKTMEVVPRDELRLDRCRRCGGVWLDAPELVEIWNRELAALEAPPPERDWRKTVRTAEAALDTLVWMDPIVLQAGARLGGAALRGTGRALAHAPEVAGHAVEATSTLAGAVFNAIADVVAALTKR